MSRDLVQVLSNCPQCRVEGALVELVEESTGGGEVVESSCRMCGRHTERGRCVAPGVAFRQEGEALAALERWAEVEGEPDVEQFARVNFGGLAPAEIADLLIAREPITTCFDAVAWLFPGSALGGSGLDAGEPPAEDPIEGDVTAARGVAAGDPRDDPARVAARALITVMVGDGKIRPEERQFIDQCMLEFGYPPISEFDIRAWRPGQLGRPENTVALVEAMARLVYVDRERDGSEWRIVREFARYWGYPMDRLELLEQELDEEYASRMKRLWISVRRLFVKEQTW